MDADAFNTALAAMAARVATASADIAIKGALTIQAAAMGNLHTGYGVVSGTMRRSIHSSGPFPSGEGAFTAWVSPGVIYARRFELGYRGPDSLGRVFNQRPRPFFKPAASSQVPLIQAYAARTWAAAIGG